MTKFEPNLADAAVGMLKPDAASGLLQRVDVDVAVVGAGFAGSLAALVLARQGYSNTVIDPYAVYPSDFRCEKFSDDQAALLDELGVSDLFRRDDVLGADGLTGAGLRYDQMVNVLRGAWPETLDVRVGKVMDIAPDRTGATLTLAGGEMIRCRLVILATGPGEKLRASLGLTRQVLSASHSVTLGFDLEAEDGGDLGLDGLIHRGERAGDGVGYVSFFRLGQAQRANLFVYDDLRSDRVRRLREDPVAELRRIAPHLASRLARARLAGSVELRAVDLYTVDASRLDGVVLVGDARRTSCPASGTGVERILHDVKLLSKSYIPQWLDQETRSGGDLAAFYRDEALTARDTLWERRSRNGRMTALSRSPAWRARRLAQALKARLRSAAQTGRR